MRRFRRRIAVCGAGLAIALGGCAIVHVEGGGVRPMAGVVRATPLPAEAGAARMMTISTWGLALFSAPEGGTGAALGYGRQTLLILGDDACVDLKAGGPCAALAENKQGGTR